MTPLLFTLTVAVLTTQGVHAYQRLAHKQCQYKHKNKLYFIEPYSVHVTMSIDAENAKYFAEPLLSSGHLITLKNSIYSV